MKLKILFLNVLLCYAMHGDLFSQCAVVDFTLQPSACRNENLIIDNQSDPGAYTWDFCVGELNNTPTAMPGGVISGANGRPGIELAKDGNKWFGFITGTFSNTLHRLEFDNGIDQAPTKIENLGDLGGALNSPGQIRLIHEGNNWFGILHNTGSNELLKLEFQNQLSGLISVSLLTSGVGTINSGIAVGRDAIHGWVCVISDAGNVFTMVRLGTDLHPSNPADIINSPDVPNPNNLGDVDLINHCGEWYGMASNFGGGNVYRLKFGSNLFSVPQIDQLTSLPVSNNGRLRLAREGEEYFLFITSLDGIFHKFKFGNDLNSAPTIINEGNLQNVFLANTYGLALAKENSVWSIIVISQSDGQLYSVNHAQDCSALPYASNEVAPALSYTSSGAYTISLENATATGVAALTKTVTVSSQISPDITFNTQNICANNDISLFSENTSGNITSYDWDFGDMTSHSSDPNPIHQYAVAGEYSVGLVVTGDNGCQNNSSNVLKIYQEPVAGFTLPSGLMCTNNEFTFINTTSDNFDGYLSHEWFVDDLPAATDTDLTISFTTTGVKSVKLRTSIPGCSSELTQSTSNVQAGPIVDFSFLGNCASEEVQFTTNISDPVTGQTWDFNDGNTSTDANPVNTFVTAGEYSVSLSATSTNGCNNSITKPVVIYSLPVVDFSIPAPPLSCTGTSTQFSNLTADPPDGTITSWLWDFDDATATENTSNLQEPSHTFANAGSYDVTLTATTGEECSSTLQKTITIEQSPSATVGNSVACKSLPVNFTATGTDIQSYYWEIGTSYYIDANPAHTFSVPGDHQILLTVQGNNNCETTYERIISVPVPLAPDFSVLKNCVDHQTEFTDITMGADPVAQQAWDFAGMATATGSPAVHSFNSLGSKSITLNVTAESGCSYSVSRTIDIAQAPTASFDASPEAGAMPLVVRFTNNSAEATQHEWTFGDEAQGTSNEISPSYTFQNTGEFLTELKASNNEGCESTATKLITVVAPLPDVDIRRINVSENPDGSIQLIITLENKGNTFLENLPVDVDISGKVALREVIEESIAPASMYNLVLSYSLTQLSGLSFLCASTTLANDLVPEGNQICIELDDKVFLFSPYPNPVKNDLELTWIAPAEEAVTFTLVDAFGKTVLSSSLSSTPGLNRTVYDVTHLGIGIYILTLKAGSASKTQRIVISREN